MFDKSKLIVWICLFSVLLLVAGCGGTTGQSAADQGTPDDQNAAPSNEGEANSNGSSDDQNSESEEEDDSTVAFATISGEIAGPQAAGAEIHVYGFNMNGNLRQIVAINSPVFVSEQNTFEYELTLNDLPEPNHPLLVMTSGGEMEESSIIDVGTMVTDSQLLAGEGTIVHCTLSAPDAIAVKLLIALAEVNALPPTSEDAGLCRTRVESELIVDLPCDASEVIGRCNTLYRSIEQNLNSNQTTGRTAAANEFINYLAANLSSLSNRLDQTMTDPERPGTDIAASFAPFPHLSLVLDGGPAQFIFMRLTASKTDVSGNGYDSATISATLTNAMGLPVDDDKQVDFSLPLGDGLLSNPADQTEEGVAETVVASTAAGTVTVQATCPNGKQAVISEEIGVSVTESSGDLPVALYLLDEFMQDESAPLASPRNCQPGPGRLNLTDPQNRAYVSTGDYLTIAQGEDQKDAGWVSEDAFKREPGLVWVLRGTLPRGSAAGLWRAPSFLLFEAGLAFRNNYGKRLVYIDGESTEIEPPDEAENGYAVVINSGGAWFFWRTSGYWRLVYNDKSSTASDYYTVLVDNSTSLAIGKVTVAKLACDMDERSVTLCLEQLYHEVEIPDTANQEALLNIFNGAMNGAAAGLYRLGQDYWMWLDLGTSRYWHVQLAYVTHPDPSVGINALMFSKITASSSSDDQPLADIHSTYSAWEYVFDADGWMGNGHGRENQTALHFTVDGTEHVLADGDAIAGSSISVVRESELLLADGTRIADAITEYGLTPQNGLTVSVEIAFNHQFDKLTGYMAMGPFDEVLNVGSWVGAKREYFLNRDDGTVYTGNSGFLYAFEDGGHYAFALHFSDGRTLDVSLQDRSHDGINKFYGAFPAKSIQPGEVVSFENTYKTVFLDDTGQLYRK